MIRFEIKSYGVRLTFGGIVTVPQAVHLKTKFQDFRATRKPPFGVIADIRNLVPFVPEVKVLLQELEEMSKKAGLQRRAVIYRSPVARNQASQLSFLSMTDKIERRIDANVTADWEKVALAWVVDGIEPSTASTKSNGHVQPG